MITIKTAYKYAMLRALTGSKGTAIKTASGVIASFETNTELPITKGKFNIAYNSNGISSMAIIRCKKNLFNSSTVFSPVGSYLYARNVFPQGVNLICSFVDKDPTVDISGLYFGFIDNEYTSGTVQSGQYRWLIENGTIKTNLTNITSTSVICNSLFAYPRNQTTLDRIFARYDIQIELGSTPSTYEAYQGTTYPVSFGTTIYGGCFDSVTGELYSTLDSDGTPLETPVKTELTPISITTFKGDNNIFCDTGDSDIEYIAKAASKKDRILSYLPLIYGRKELL